MAIPGQFNDGRTLRSQPVAVDFSLGDTVVIIGTDRSWEVPLAELRVSDRLGGIARFLYLPDGGVIETTENDAVDAALASRRRGRVAGVIHALERHRGITAVATLLLVVVSVSLLYFGLPRAARRVAMAVPPTIEEQAGRAALLAIRQQGAPTALDRNEQNRVRRQLIRLLPERVAAERPKLEFLGLGELPNAFALPGNTIVVTDAFVRLTRNDDEIAAVLAHEIGHLQNRHGMQSVLRGSFALLVVTSLTGDLATLTSFASTLPLVLLQNGYSRDLEREADQFAYDLLIEREIPLRGFATILRRMQGERPGAEPFTYLSTHPPTDDRVARFDPVLLGQENPSEPSAPSGRVQASPPVVVGSSSGQSSLEPVVPGTRNTPPRLTHSVTPVYPPLLRIQGVEGQAIIGFVVASDGTVADLHVVSATHPDFGPAALEAVRQWTFEPGFRNGSRVATKMQVPVGFSLNPAPK